MRPQTPSRPIISQHVLSVACLLLGFYLAFAPTVRAQDVTSRCCGYHVTGYVWHDLNSNGIDESEPRLEGWTVQVYSITGAYLAGTEVTDALGEFTFDTPVGCANVDAVFTLVLQPGFTQTYPTDPITHSFFGIGGCGALYENVNFGVVGEPCSSHVETWTLDGEFATGELNGVQTVSDNLELTPTPTTLGFAWIANTLEGTVSRVDVSTGNEVGRYYTGPPMGGDYTYLAPSRTAVDEDGNCWVLNRNFGGQTSLTQILAEGGIDRNASSVIETSQDNILVNGQIDPAELLPWGDDERVARHYLVGGTMPDNLGRALTIDKTGHLWVGLHNGERVVQLDPSLSTVTYAPDLTPVAPPELTSISTSPFKPYGLALSPSGLLYGLERSSFAFEIDPGLGSGGTGAGPAMTQFIDHTGTATYAIGNYGIAVDQDCVVWLTASHISDTEFGCIRWDPSVGVGDPSAGWSLSMPGATSSGRGITVDYDGNVWMTINAYVGGGDSVAKYAPTDPATFLGQFDTGLSVALGVGVASDENIIVTDQNTSSWAKLNKDTGALIPLPGPQLAGPYPYTYSDFTGSLQAIANEQQGFWTAISDAGSSSMIWTTVTWNETSPPGTGVEVEYRVANSLGTLPSESWIALASSGAIPPTPGQFMEVRVRLTREIDCGLPFVTPQLHDITVTAECDLCTLGPCEPIVVLCESPGGTVVDYPAPTWSDDALCLGEPIICTPPSGSLFAVGTTPVTCTTVSALGDTITCAFPVVVTGDCDRVVGGCCIEDDCTLMTEAECDAVGGIYLGDTSDCERGCEFTCTRPPRSMLAWFPLDDAPGGVTPNLAEPAAPGLQGGTPANNPGEWVTASYHFDRADAADEFVADDHATLDFYTSDFTIDAWIRTSTFPGINNILDKREDSPVRGYRLFLVNGFPALELAAGGSSAIFSLGPADSAAYVANGDWHMLAVTVDRDIPIGVQFYLDGNPVGSPQNPTTVTGNAGNSADLAIGRSHAVGGGSVEWFDGDLDEVEIFRRKLSAAEILALYRAGATGKCREACYVPQKIAACHGNTANTTITICNYDDDAHLYSWGLSPSSAGCATAASSFSPSSGSVTVGPGDCVTIPVAIEVPSAMPAGGTACFNVSVFNHDTGRYFGCNGEIRKNQWWCSTWKQDPVTVLEGFFAINPLYPASPLISVSHIGPITPGTVLSAEVRAVSHENEGIASENLSLNGRDPGESLFLQIPIPDDGSEAEVAITVEALGQQYLNADKLVLWADDDMDGIPDPISELIIHTTTDVPASVPDDVPAFPGRSFSMVPNPFNPTTNIQFVLPGAKPMPVDLRIFDVQGRKVRTIYSMTMLQPGLHTVVWDGKDKRGNRVASGVYMLQLVTPESSETVKAILLK